MALVTPAPTEEGFTLIELIVVVGIIGILIVMAVPRVSALLQQARYAHAIKDLKSYVTNVHTYRMDHRGELPDDWSAMGFEQSQNDSTRGPFDPWDNRYVYWISGEKRKCHKQGNIQSNPHMRMKRMRVDGQVCPINSFFDLFSEGPDQDHHFMIGNPKSRDDVIVAQDGQFVGKAKDY